MDALDPATFQSLVAAGGLQAKYAATIDRQSAHEIITGRIAAAQAPPRRRLRHRPLLPPLPPRVRSKARSRR